MSLNFAGKWRSGMDDGLPLPRRRFLTAELGLTKGQTFDSVREVLSYFIKRLKMARVDGLDYDTENEELLSDTFDTSVRSEYEPLWDFLDIGFDDAARHPTDGSVECFFRAAEKYCATRGIEKMYIIQGDVQRRFWFPDAGKNADAHGGGVDREIPRAIGKEVKISSNPTGFQVFPGGHPGRTLAR
jgi:hypothetical protein